MWMTPGKQSSFNMLMLSFSFLKNIKKNACCFNRQFVIAWQQLP